MLADDYLNNQYPFIKKILFIAVFLWLYESMLKSKPFLEIASLYTIFASFFHKYFWGEKIAIATVGSEKNGKLTIEVSVKEPQITSPFGIDYPTKKTLDSLEDSIREQLLVKLKAITQLNVQSYDALTHCLAKEAITKNRDLFYLEDQTKVEQSSYLKDDDMQPLIELGLVKFKAA